jgi:phosphoribosylformylglycinamidine synthase subunit PurL
VILLLGSTNNDFGGSEVLALFGAVAGAVPQLDLPTELAVQQTCLAAIQARLICSAHDCSEGGLAVALAESCFSHDAQPAIGASIKLDSSLLSSPSFLFSETPSRILVSVRPENVAQVQALAAQHNAACAVIGEVGSESLAITIDGQEVINQPVRQLETAWRTTLPKALSEDAVRGA